MSRSARPIIGILNANKVRLKVEFFQPEIPRAETGCFEENKKNGRCDLFQGGHGSELAPLGILVYCINSEVHPEYILLIVTCNLRCTYFLV